MTPYPISFQWVQLLLKLICHLCFNYSCREDVPTGNDLDQEEIASAVKTFLQCSSITAYSCDLCLYQSRFSSLCFCFIFFFFFFPFSIWLVFWNIIIWVRIDWSCGSDRNRNVFHVFYFIVIFFDPTYDRYFGTSLFELEIDWSCGSDGQGWIKWFLPQEQGFKLKAPLHIVITPMWWFPCHFLGVVLPAPSLYPRLLMGKRNWWSKTITTHVTWLIPPRFD